MGIVIEADEMLDRSILGATVGPTVVFNSFTESTSEWKGSVGLAVNMPEDQAQALTIRYGVGSNPFTDVGGNVLLSLAGWTLLRFPIQATLTSSPQSLPYAVSTPVPVEGTIQLPCADKPWHLIGYSCHDARQTKVVGTTCWEKVAALHRQSPVHAMLGTGDQLYNDNVWACETLQPWLEIKDLPQRLATTHTPEQKRDVAEFYLFSYLRWLKFHPLGAANIAAIPQVNTWDDHDIFDGWGSYPPDLQMCGMFQMIFLEAKSFFQAFQLHTNDKRRAQDGFFGGTGLSWVRQLGPGLAVSALDTRTERTLAQIIPMERVNELAVRLDQLSGNIQHLLFISAVPVAYTDLAIVEKGIKLLQKATFLTKTGLMDSLMNEFGQVELLDDVVDSWGSGPHKVAKVELLVRLKALSAARHIRVTLLSGDVHQCTMAYVESAPRMVDGKKIKLAHALDPGFMPQVVSSAIGYGPPPDPLVKLLHASSSATPKACNPGAPADKALTEVQGELFKDDPPAGSTKFANCNNFVEASLQAAPGVPGVHNLVFNLWVKGKSNTTMRVTRIPVPPLLTGGTSEQQAAAASLQMDQFKAVHKSKLAKCMPCI